MTSGIQQDAAPTPASHPPPQLLTDHLDLWTTAVRHKSTAGRGSGNGKKRKIELAGIHKLRELILELAVRGKLVPQDPDDEPASELLKRIEAEKAKLIKDGKLKKQKPLPAVTDEEKPFELPQGWEWSPLGQVVEIERGITFPSGEKSNIPEDGRVACLRTTNVQDKIEWDDLLYIRKQFISRTSQYIQENDIVMSMANSRELVGKVAIINNPPIKESTFGGFLSAIRTKFLESRFVLNFLRMPTTRELLIGSASQTTNIANISLAKLNPLPTPVPPLAEQQRIVAKVDELMALCDQLEQQSEHQLDAHQQLTETLLSALLNPAAGALTNATSAQELNDNWQRLAQHFDLLFSGPMGVWAIDRLKDTILQLAVMGKLVPQNPDDEPAAELLKRIDAEKARLMKEGKIKKQKPLPPVSDDKKPFELPEGWEWVRLNAISTLITDGTHHTPTYVESGVPFLSVKDMSSGDLNFNDTRHITQEEHDQLISRCHPEYGDLLLTKVGTTGVPVLIDTKRPFSIFVSVALIKFPQKFIYGQYLKHIFNAPLLKTQSTDGTEGVGNKNLVLRKINMFKIPTPPLSEQHRIVAKVDELFALCDQLKERLQQASDTQLNLTDALVEQALS